MGIAIGGYQVFKQLSRGASCETTLLHKGHHTVQAVGKRLVPRFRGDPIARAQLDVEARVLRALAGRGAPRLLDAGEDDEGPWLVMEHLAMAPLSARIGEGDDTSAFVTRIAGATFRALGTVHDARDAAGPLDVVHGDVSPDNLLVHDEPCAASFVDFGLSHFRDARALPSGALSGTVRYVAPEVARGEIPTAQSDLFSLGLSLLHAASGEPPRTGTELAALLVQAGEVAVLAYAERAARGLGPELRDALLGTIAFEPGDRPKSAREAWRRGSW